jgi:hypothetical protein
MRTVLTLAAAAACTFSALAEPIDVHFATPARDRWNYGFGGSGSWTRPTASTFGAIGLAGFDDRDGQFFLGFDTNAQVTPGLDPARYHLTSVTLTATIALDGDQLFEYDPSFDALSTYLDPAAGGTPDQDAGRPVELFAVGYRNGFDAGTYVAPAPYGGAPVVPPIEGSRNAYPSALAADGTATTDVSRNVRLGFEVTPLAVGTTTAVKPGSLVPAGATFTFTLDLEQPGAEAYLRQALAGGRLNLMIATLHHVEQGVAICPIFSTMEDATGVAPTLDIVVSVAASVDWNNDGVVNSTDVSDFINDWFTDQANGTVVTDFNHDGVSNSTDVSDFINAWFEAQ